MNTKGASITSWTFTIILVLLLVFIVQSQVLSPMNEIYNSSLETGLDTSALDEFDSLKTSANTEIEGAEVSNTGDGLTLPSSWSIIKGIYGTISGFFDGSFFGTLLTENLGLPPIIASTLTILCWISLILIIVYIFMKVVP